MSVAPVILTIMAAPLSLVVAFSMIDLPTEEQRQAASEWHQIIEDRQWDQASMLLESHSDKDTTQWLLSRAQISLMQGEDASESLSALSRRDLSIAETQELESIYRGSDRSSDGVEPIEWLESTRSTIDAFQFWLSLSLLLPIAFLLFFCLPMHRNYTRLCRELPQAF